MMKLSKVLALASFLFLGASGLKAQQNLILNPSFEEEHTLKAKNPQQFVTQHWATPMNSDPALVVNGHTGKALKIVPNRVTATFQTSKTNIVDGALSPEQNYINVTPGSEYTLSFWYKVGESTRARVGFRLNWVKTDGSEDYENRDRTNAPIRMTSQEWKQEQITFTAPENAQKLSVIFRVTDGRGEELFFDDISLVETRPAAPPTPPAPAVPTELKATNKFQRELELSWAAATSTGTTWELQVGDASPIVVSKNSHTLEDLEPNTSYAIKVRAKANNVTSEWTSVLNVQTADYTERPESTARVPHLRTISEEGTCQQNLLLYYNDLADKAANISYKVDGISITPQGKVLTFPKTGKQVLSIEIAESSEKVWTLEYNVNVQ